MWIFDNSSRQEGRNRLCHTSEPVKIKFQYQSDHALLVHIVRPITKRNCLSPSLIFILSQHQSTLYLLIYVQAHQFHQELQMNCKKNLLPTIIVFFMVALIGYLIISIFVVPIKAECSSMDIIPEDAVVDVSMGDWIYSNMLAGIIFFSLITSLTKAKNGDGTCLVIFFIILFSLYCLFEIVWGTIGILLFQQTYHDACSQSDSFNSYVIAELIYGMLLFPSILICAIALVIISTRKEKSNTDVASAVPVLQQPILGGDAAPVSQPTPNPSANVYEAIYSRLSGSFGSSEGRIN